jgi:hypothetical protein
MFMVENKLSLHCLNYVHGCKINYPFSTKWCNHIRDPHAKTEENERRG